MNPSNRNIKVVFVLDSFPNNSESFILNQILGVKKVGCKVAIFVNKLNDIEQSIYKKQIQEHNLLSLIHKRTNHVFSSNLLKLITTLKLLVLNTKLLPVFLNLLKVRRREKFKVMRLLVDLKNLRDADVFHIHFANNGLFLKNFKNLNFLKTNTRVITNFHGYDAHYCDENLLYKKKVYSEILDLSSSILVNSSYLKAKVLTLGARADKIKILPIPVDTSKFVFKNKIPDSTISLITIGRIIKLKGHVYGLNTVKVLKEKGFDVRYTIIGEGGYKPFLKWFIKRYNLEHNVFLEGSKTQKEVVKHLHKNDFYLGTSIITKNNNAEAFGVVTAEAQATGTPVVAFNTGGVSETIKNGFTGYLVNNKDYYQMALRIIELKNDADKYSIFSKNANLFAKEKFESKKLVKKLMSIYEA
jgi:colanic acid/amylovoran biosynthesis glycosyltransferase